MTDDGASPANANGGDDDDRPFLILWMPSLPSTFAPADDGIDDDANDENDECNGNGTVRITSAFMIASEIGNREEQKKTKKSIHNYKYKSDSKNYVMLPVIIRLIRRS